MNFCKLLRSQVRTINFKTHSEADITIFFLRILSYCGNIFLEVSVCQGQTKQGHIFYSIARKLDKIVELEFAKYSSFHCYYNTCYSSTVYYWIYYFCRPVVWFSFFDNNWVICDSVLIVYHFGGHLQLVLAILYTQQ